MAGRKSRGQLPLEEWLEGRKPRKGVVERASERDLRELRKRDTIPAGLEALTTAYRLTAREVDRAELEKDRWGKIAATRELRAVREQLGINPTESTGDDRDELLEQLSATPRHTADA